MRAVLLAALFALNGCADSADAIAAEGEQAAQLPASDAATSSGEAPPFEVPRLTLTHDGLMLTPERGNPPRSFAFGTPRAEVETLAERHVGAVTDRSRNEECGAGPIDFTEYGPLILNFQDDRFVGWFAGDGTRVATADGVVPGATRAQLESTLTVAMIPDTTLEGEFEYAGRGGEAIGGFLDGSGQDARVTALYAGINCFFR